MAAFAKLGRAYAARTTSLIRPCDSGSAKRQLHVLSVQPGSRCGRVAFSEGDHRYDNTDGEGGLNAAYRDKTNGHFLRLVILHRRDRRGICSDHELCRRDFATCRGLQRRRCQILQRRSASFILLFVARMKRSEIRERHTRFSIVPGLRFAASGLRLGPDRDEAGHHNRIYLTKVGF